MITIAEFRKLALETGDNDERPHFERQAFRAGGKVFATLLETAHSANLKLSPEEQYAFTRAHPAITPVPGGWGRMGFTTVDLDRIPKALFKQMLKAAAACARTKKSKR